RVDRELLAQHSEGLIVLSGCLNSEVSRLLSAGEETKARETAGWYQEVFGKDFYFMEVQSHGLTEQARVTEGAIRIGNALGAPVCGTNDSHYLKAPDARPHAARRRLHTGTTMGDPNRRPSPSAASHVKSADDTAATLQRV